MDKGAEEGQAKADVRRYKKNRTPAREMRFFCLRVEMEERLLDFCAQSIVLYPITYDDELTILDYFAIIRYWTIGIFYR